MTDEQAENQPVHPDVLPYARRHSRLPSSALRRWVLRWSQIGLVVESAYVCIGIYGLMWLSSLRALIEYDPHYYCPVFGLGLLCHLVLILVALGCVARDRTSRQLVFIHAGAHFALGFLLFLTLLFLSDLYIAAQHSGPWKDQYA